MWVEDVITILDRLNWQGLAAVFASSWFFVKLMKKSINERMDRTDNELSLIKDQLMKIDKQFEKIDKQFEKINERFEKIDLRNEKMMEKLNSIDQRLFRMEITHELLSKNEHQLPKAE